MPFICRIKRPVSLYYRLELKNDGKKYVRCADPLYCTGVSVHAPDDPERAGQEIRMQLNGRDDQGLVLSHMALLTQHMALLGKEVEPNMICDTKGLFRAPVQDLVNGDIRIVFLVGDLPQWDLPLAHLGLLRSSEFPPLVIPPRQYFYLMANHGEEQLWDGSVIWVVLSGYKQQWDAINEEMYGKEETPDIITPANLDCPECKEIGQREDAKGKVTCSTCGRAHLFGLM